MNALSISVALMALAFCIGCGVKGDPIPPERSAEIGRGKPTYRRAAKHIDLKKQEPVTEPDEEDEEESEEVDY